MIRALFFFHQQPLTVNLIFWKLGETKIIGNSAQGSLSLEGGVDESKLDRRPTRVVDCMFAVVSCLCETPGNAAGWETFGVSFWVLVTAGIAAG